MKKKLFLILLLIPIVVGLTACDFLEIFTTKYNVSFYSDGELFKKLEVKENSLIEEPSLQLKEGYEFLGWYKDLTNSSSKWDFKNDKVNGNLRLDAFWELKLNYLTVTNISVVLNVLTWDEIEDATYKINLLDKELFTTQNEFVLEEYKKDLKESKNVFIEPLKEGFVGISSEVRVKYNDSFVSEAYKVEFDEFDFTGFELNRSTYKTTLIDHEDHHLYIEEGRLTTVSELPKTGSVALILRDEGGLELKEGYDNFVSLEFSLGNYQNSFSTSTLMVYVTNNPLGEWSLVDSFNNESTAGFTEFKVEDEDICKLVDLRKKVYLKMVSNVSGASAKNIVIDDIMVKQTTPAYYQVTLKGQIGKLEEYYKSAEGLKGKTLVEELRIIVSTNLNDIRYRDYKEIGEFADIKKDDPTLVRGIYDVKDLKANWGSRSEWHREHVWPNSRLGMDRVKENEVNQGSDPHNLRAIYPSTNSSRSNRYFDYETGDALGRTIGKDKYYPGDLDKGDVARILLYMVVRYEFLGLTDHLELLSRKAYTPEAGFMGKLSVLLDWHNEDPVDEFELYRNEKIFEYQNNRNPFIDHPELFIEVFEYLITVDENRVVTVQLYFEFLVNYGELLKDKEKWVN